MDPMNDPMLHQLFRVFSYFADLCPSGTLFPPQAHFILTELQKASELPTTSRDFVFDTDCITFRELLTYVETLFMDRSELEVSIKRLYEKLILQIIRKNFVLYRRRGDGCLIFNRKSEWKAAWMTIMPGIIDLRPIHKFNKKKTLSLEKTSTALIGPKEEELFLLYVDSSNNHYTLAHIDEIKRDSLARDIKSAIAFRTRAEMTDHHRHLAQRSFVNYKTREPLWRISLETENSRLLQMIEEGKRSLRDEEIVRSLAARMLEEEREKNEQLTQLIMHLERQLRVSNQPENTTISINLERIEEEGTDEVQVIQRDQEGDEETRDLSYFTDHSITPSNFESEGERATPYDEVDEPSAVERARRERELYLITSTQSI